MRTPVQILFGGIFFAGLVVVSPSSDNYWMIGVGLAGFLGSFLIPEK